MRAQYFQSQNLDVSDSLDSGSVSGRTIGCQLVAIAAPVLPSVTKRVRAGEGSGQDTPFIVGVRALFDAAPVSRAVFPASFFDARNPREEGFSVAGGQVGAQARYPVSGRTGSSLLLTGMLGRLRGGCRFAALCRRGLSFGRLFFGNGRRVKRRAAVGLLRGGLRRSRRCSALRFVF